MNRSVETAVPGMSPAQAAGAGRSAYTVKIPAGVKDGTRIKLKGKGEAGYGFAPAGDLVLLQRIRAVEDLRSRGDDLIISVPRSRIRLRLSAEPSRCRPLGRRDLAQDAERR